MRNKEDQFVDFLEKRIDFYRHCMVWAFILGLSAGGCIFCGEKIFPVPEPLGLPPIAINILLLFFIAITGIAAGSAYRRRIRLLKDCREKILLEFCNRRFFPGLAREGIITEMQALFAIMFILALVVVFIQYPVPKFPDFQGCSLVRMIPLAGFLGFCWISIWPERKNYLQDYLEGKSIPIRVHSNRPKFLETYRIESGDSRKGEISQLQRRSSLQP
jgi:hypothetical protein